MRRELTRRHFSFFENRLINPLGFIRDLYQYGKFRELSSFVIWELLHQCRLFRPAQYLQFNREAVLSLQHEHLNHIGFRNQVTAFFQANGLRALPAEQPWKLLYHTNDGALWGCLYPNDRELYTSTDNGQSITFVTRFAESIKSIFVSSQQTLFVGVKGAVYRSTDNGASFHKVLQLGSAVSFFRHNNEMTETPDKTLIIGEYGNVWEETRWKKLAYLYFSADDGATWERSDFLIDKGTNKHVHLVHYSPTFNKVLMADGDNYKKLWISDALTLADLKKPENWRVVNRFHIQMGGYTAVVENAGKIFFGTDYQGGTNFVVTTTDGVNYTKAIVPDPYRRSPIDNMVLRRSQTGVEIWANLPYSTSKTKSLLMYTADGGQSWNKVLEYNSAAYKVWLLNAAQDIATDLYFSIEDLKNNERVVYQVTDEA